MKRQEAEQNYWKLQGAEKTKPGVQATQSRKGSGKYPSHSTRTLEELRSKGKDNLKWTTIMKNSKPVFNHLMTGIKVLFLTVTAYQKEISSVNKDDLSQRFRISLSFFNHYIWHFQRKITISQNEINKGQEKQQKIEIVPQVIQILACKMWTLK